MNRLKPIRLAVVVVLVLLAVVVVVLFWPKAENVVTAAAHLRTEDEKAANGPLPGNVLLYDKVSKAVTLPCTISSTVRWGGRLNTEASSRLSEIMRRHITTRLNPGKAKEKAELPTSRQPGYLPQI